MANLVKVPWGRVRLHWMEPVRFRLGDGDCVITHCPKGGRWVNEQVRPFLAKMEDFLSYLCEGQDGTVYPFIPQGNVPRVNGG